MEVLVLHILKLNIIAAVIILLVKLLAIPLKGRVSARWKYLIWLFVAVSLLIPVRVPGSISLIDLRLQKYSADSAGIQENRDSMTVLQNGQQMTTQSGIGSKTENMQNQNHSIRKVHTIYESGKWTGMVSGIFAAVWLIVAVLKLAGEFLAYYLSMKNLERMSLPVSDPLSLRMYREVCCDRKILKMPELRQNAGLTTPLLAGLFHTKLYLPATGYSAEERKLVFYHELTHYAHRDLWYKMVLRICASVYWFNPFLLIMLKEADKDIENLCDTVVVHRVNPKEHRLYRQLLLRTVAMENRVPYVTASLNDSGMVFKDRILYMVNIQKLRRGILPGVLLVVMLAGGNLAFTVSAGTDAAPARTEKPGQAEENEVRNENPTPQAAENSELVDMQEITEAKDGQDGTEVTTAENVSQNAENATETTDTETASMSDEENGAQAMETSASENGYDSDGATSYYENLPAGVPYTSGFNGSSGVGSIVASGEGDTESRVLYDNGDGTYSDDNGFQYSYQGDGNWADANGNSYRTWNDSDYNSGTQLDQRQLQGSSGSVEVKETTNGDYYYRDANGVGYTDNGDGTWTDENGNTYTE